MNEYLNKKKIIGKFSHHKWEKIETDRKNKSNFLTLRSKEDQFIRFIYTPELINLISSIEKDRGFLTSLKVPKYYLKKLSSQAIEEEAYYSSHIEGALTSLEEALLNLKSKKHNYADESMQMIYNNKKALDFMKKITVSKLSHETIHKLHQILVYNTHKEKPITVGKYRPGPIYVIDQYGQIVYEGPPANKVHFMMDQLLKWINSENRLHPLIKAAAIHFYFVHVHPFDDGNGRSARALSNLLLSQSNYQFINFLSPSSYFDHHRSAYYKSIRNVEEHDYDLTYFLLYYLEALFTQLEKVKKEIKKEKKYTNIKNTLNQKTYTMLNKRQVKSIKYMLEKNETLSTKKYCKINHCSDETARNDFNLLMSLNIIKAKGQGRSRVYDLA